MSFIINKLIDVVHYFNPITEFNELPIADSVWSEYRELTRRVPYHEMKAIEEKVHQLPAKEATLAELQAALNRGDWKAAIFHNPDFHLYALLAFMKGDISRSSLATILFYADAIDMYGIDQIKSIPLFVNGKINDESKQFFEGSFFLGTIKNAELCQIYIAIRKFPPCEQQFFYIKSHKIDEESVSARISEVGVNLFNGTEDGYGKIIPSIGIMQAFLDAYTGEDAVKIRPVLGLSSVDDLSDPLYRDMAIRFKGISLPDQADGHKAPGFDFSYHDFFHALICSTPIRKPFLKIADFTSGSRDVTRLLRNAFVDMEDAKHHYVYYGESLEEDIAICLSALLKHHSIPSISESFLARLEKEGLITSSTHSLVLHNLSN